MAQNVTAHKRSRRSQATSTLAILTTFGPNIIILDQQIYSFLAVKVFCIFVPRMSTAHS